MMARIVLQEVGPRAWARALFVIVLLVSPTLGAQPREPGSLGEPQEGAASPEDGARPRELMGDSDVRRPVGKIRQGSMLHRDQPLEPPPDLRTDWERRRDAAVARHVQRVAELDVIAEIAARAGDVSLQEKVDVVRRKELGRYYDEMMALQRELRRGLVEAEGGDS